MSEKKYKKMPGILDNQEPGRFYGNRGSVLYYLETHLGR
jgi:hypothetical protein